MPFLGTTPTQGFVSSFPKQSFTPNGSTTVFTLTNPVASANDLEVFVGNVRQEPTTAYTAAGTTLTMSEAPNTGLNFYVINKSFAQVTTTPPVNSISTDKLLNDAVTGAKIENNPTIAGNLTSTGLITASSGVAIGGTGSANTLDDYEEGTWTPGISGRTFGSTFGFYTKIGNVVTVYFDMNTMAGGDVTTPFLTGLPFTSSNSSSIQYAGYMMIHEPYGQTGNGDRTYVYFRIDKNGTTGKMLQGGGDTGTFSHQDGNVMGNGDNARGMGQYFTDA